MQKVLPFLLGVMFLWLLFLTFVVFAIGHHSYDLEKELRSKFDRMSSKY